MAKFIHTADWHIGLRARHAGSYATNLRAERLLSVRRILNMAVLESADFILVAGDVFDNSDVERESVREVVEILNDSIIPIYVIPGNHDPYLPMSVWESSHWRNRRDRIHFLIDAAPISAPGNCTIYPCPIFQKTSIVDPTAWIPDRAPGDSSIRIGLAHGSLQILNEQTPLDFPIRMDRQVRAGLDYLALGDWHGTRVVGSTAYSGTHEQTSFADKNSGNVLVVEFSQAGTAPLIRAERVGRCVWNRMDVSVRDITDVEALVANIEALGAPEALCLNLMVQIAEGCGDEARAALVKLHTGLGGCLWLQWADDNVVSTEAKDRIPDGFLREVYAQLDEEGQSWMRELAMRIGQ